MSIIIDESAIKRIENLRTLKSDPALMLRIRVEGGGCSGFQYKMELTNEKAAQDQDYAGCVLIDDISIPFMDGSTISFEDGLIGSDFKITNPNAVAGCGCGTSFSMV